MTNEDKENLQKWLGLDLNIDYERIDRVRYYFPFVNFSYKYSLSKEELKKYRDFTEVLIGKSGYWPFDK